MGQGLQTGMKIPSKTKRRRDFRTGKGQLPNPDVVVNSLLKFLGRRVGVPMYRVKVAFRRGFMPKIPREMRDDVSRWFDQMTSDSGRFFDNDGFLGDHQK